MTEEFNIYAEEEGIIADTRRTLSQHEPPTPDEWKDALANLLIHYERLFKVTKHLINISDRKEKELNSLNRRLAKLADMLEYQATHDLLTSILNKASITDFVSGCLEQAGLVIVVYDIDEFKKVNDTYGHLVGDYALQWVVNLVAEMLGGVGQQGRIGGEEFIIVLPFASLEEGFKVAERLRQGIENALFTYESHTLRITVSLGVTYCGKGERFEAVYARADRALYQAKRNGRNRVETA
jgi:diguanylate cyclase (GGDEF)-like protein